MVYASNQPHISNDAKDENLVSFLITRKLYTLIFTVLLILHCALCGTTRPPHALAICPYTYVYLLFQTSSVITLTVLPILKVVLGLGPRVSVHIIISLHNRNDYKQISLNPSTFPLNLIIKESLRIVYRCMTTYLEQQQ